MLFVLSCIDKPGHGAVRAENRPAHLDFLKANAARIKVAGPYLDDAGESMVGSLLIIEAADAAEARAFAEADPYARAGLFERVEIRPWKWVVGQPEGA